VEEQRYEMFRPDQRHRSMTSEPALIPLRHFLRNHDVLPGWISESMRMQETNPNYYGTINYDHQLVYTIHHDLFDVPYSENRTMAPSW
jgi:hypothetical protein